MLNFESYLQEKKTLVDQELSRSLLDKTMPPRLREAMQYSLDAGGKRVRPLLAIAGAEACGGEERAVLPLGVALEMIHTFSLIHDDLPAMDDDDLRRGKPTNHKAFGEATAILAGDALLAEAFFVLTSLNGVGNPRAVVEIIRDVAEAAGARGMTGGQVIDIESTGKMITEAELERLHRHKTGKLLAVSVVSGAKLSGATPLQIEAFRMYGEAIGLAFQIADDILDIEGSAAEIGKDVGSDVGHGKSTYPAIIGIEAAKRKERKLIDEAIAALTIFDERAEPLRALAQYIINRKH